MDEEIKHALRREVGEVRIWIMLRELADPAVVGAPRALGEAFELDEAGKILIPNGWREWVIFFS
jgi:hypothetical protein